MLRSLHDATTGPPTAPADERWREALRALLPGAGYALLLVVLMGPRLGELATRLPRAPNQSDAQLIAWILSWVAHATADPAATVLSPNINHPAPAQLTGSDWFLSPQLLFAPLLWITGNAVLALNLTGLALYWLAGVCCERLLRALGSAPLAAFAAGTAYLLGAYGVPFNVHILQFPPFLLPALALALTRLRQTPDARRAAVVAFVFTCALLCSMYAAILAAVLGLAWAGFELARPLPERRRFFVLGLAAALIAGATVVPLAHAYLARAATQDLPRPPTRSVLPFLELGSPLFLGFVFRQMRAEVALVLIGLAGLAGFVRRDPLARRVVPVALACMVAGYLLGTGVPYELRDSALGALFRAVRYPHRFAIVSSFGATLMVAAGIATLSARLPHVLRHTPALAVLALVLLGRATFAPEDGMREVAALGRDLGVHRAVAKIVDAEGRGAMLVLPSYGVSDRRPDDTELLEPDAMLASTVHWLPLVDGYTGHQPAHRLLLVSLVRALPGREALADLVDLTHLRWILLRPAAIWPESAPRRPFEDALRALPDVGRSWDFDGWTLLEVVRRPGHADWFASVASGPKRDTTVLGTPLAALPSGADVGVIETDRPLPSTFPTKQLLPVHLAIRNDGTATWPVSRAPSPGLILDIIGSSTVPREKTVALRAAWSALEDPPEPPTERLVRLRRDVAPGETLRQKVILVSPSAPGRYRLELSLVQVDGAPFTSPGNVRFVQDVTVVPSAAPERRRRAGPARAAG